MPTLEDLLEEVYAAPDADGPRWALAQRLEQEGDPRGELIRLQLEQARAGKATAASRARQRQLLAQHEEWLGPLAGVVVKRSVRWERGFPATGSLIHPPGKEGWDRLVKVRALATLTELDLEKGNVVLRTEDMARLLWEAPLRSLRVMKGIYRQFLPDLLRSASPWSLKTLHCVPSHSRGDLAVWERTVADLGEAFSTGTGLPRLVDLSLTDPWFGQEPARWTWLWETDAGRRLTTLRMCEQVEGFVPWHGRLSQLPAPCRLEALELFTGSSLVLVRTDSGWTRMVGALDARDRWLDRTRARTEKVLQTLGITDVQIKGL